jgi:hypothetical protein
MAHIDLPEFEEMTPAIQEKEKSILEKTGSFKKGQLQNTKRRDRCV